VLQEFELEIEVRNRKVEVSRAHLDGRRAPHVRPDQPFDARDRFTPEVHEAYLRML
jgi:hypothetical protein